MGSAVAAVLGAAQRLSPDDQLALIEALSHSLQHRFRHDVSGTVPETDDTAIPSGIERSLPITDPGSRVADFWPDDETADDINAYIAKQRAEDRGRKV
jgi:hypothetical protein